MFVTNWISTTKIQKISEITNFFRHYFLSRTEVNDEPASVLLERIRAEKERLIKEGKIKKGKVVAVIFFSFTNKCYIPTILFPNHLFSPKFTVLLQKVSN